MLHQWFSTAVDFVPPLQPLVASGDNLVFTIVGEMGGGVATGI